METYRLEKTLPIVVLESKDIESIVKVIKNSAGTKFNLIISTSIGDMVVEETNVTSFLKNKQLPNKLDSLTIVFYFETGKIEYIEISLSKDENKMSIIGNENCLIKGIHKEISDFLKSKSSKIENMRPVFIMGGYFLTFISIMLFLTNIVQYHKFSLLFGILSTIFASAFFYFLLGNRPKPIIFLKTKEKDKLSKGDWVNIGVIIVTAILIIIEIIKMIISIPVGK